VKSKKTKQISKLKKNRNRVIDTEVKQVVARERRGSGREKKWVKEIKSYKLPVSA